MGPCTASPSAAARSRVCHGPCTASHCCCQARNLQWAPVPTSSLAAARPVILSWPLYRLLMLRARSRVCHGSCTGLPLLLSPIATLCHVPLSGLSSHCWWFPFICHRVLYGLPLLLASYRHTVAPHSGFGPVTAQMSEVCGDSKIRRHSSACHTDWSVLISLPQQTPRAFKLKVQCSALI
ncbi:unnamed protein product [Staurois parvus]|uniref:Uncharacterized protein n=1 Tax=Staurois parvus TaxID=386267 RepID=A0ABN9GMF4_9NEOB|nr:unnamed protein product [Staurois parvus]